MKTKIAFLGLIISFTFGAVAQGTVSCRGDYMRSLVKNGRQPEHVLVDSVEQHNVGYFYNQIEIPPIAGGELKFGKRVHPNFDNETYYYIGRPSFGVSLFGDELKIRIQSDFDDVEKTFRRLRPGETYSAVSIINPVVVDCGADPYRLECTYVNNGEKYTSYSFARIHCEFSIGN